MGMGAGVVLLIIMVFIMGCPIPLLILCALPGTAGPNRYGPDPLNPAPDMGGSGESPSQPQRTP